MQDAAILTQIADLTPYINRDDLSEIMVNSDGSVWVECGGELSPTSIVFSPAKIGSIIRLVAGHHNFIINQDNPVLSAKFPVFRGGRFHALVPPLVSSPTFAIRMPPRLVYTLDDLYGNDTISAKDYRRLHRALMEGKNIIIAGATSAGKTTIANACLKTIIREHPRERIVISEDNPELTVDSPNSVHILINPSFSHRDAVINSLRLRPDRIIIGEIRDGGAAVELCKAWRTGHSGGITTIHAASAGDVYSRLYNLFQEVLISPDKTLIESAIDLIVFCQKIHTSSGKVVRRVTELKEIAS